MRQIVDRATFNEIATTCVGVYMAARIGVLIIEETETLLAKADALLNAAGVSYLTEVLPQQGMDSPGTGSSMDQFSQAYVNLQHLNTDLQVELQQIVTSRLQSQNYEEAAIIMLALHGQATGPGPALQQIAETATRLFRQRKWDEGRQMLRGLRRNRRIAERYYLSYIEEMMRGSRSAYFALCAEIPQVVEMVDITNCFVQGNHPVIANINGLWRELNKFLDSNLDSVLP